jgi:hypothetical protein
LSNAHIQPVFFEVFPTERARKKPSFVFYRLELYDVRSLQPGRKDARAWLSLVKWNYFQAFLPRRSYEPRVPRSEGNRLGEFLP